MDYKKTLNFPETSFEMRANLPIKEPILQKQWLDNKLYQQVLAKNHGKQTFLLHDGPPYANGNIHIGHALNKTLKDIIVRQKNLAGFYAPFIPGWDTHGLPIELAMLKKYGLNTEHSVVQRRQQCCQYALEQIENQKQQFLRIGMLSDFEKIYRTLDHEFEIKQLELFLTMVKKELVFRDKKPVYWSWSSQSALAEAEIEYKDATDPAIYLGFEAIENNVLPKNTYFVIWTTTPWTIPANLAIAINPKFNYVVFNYQDKNYVVLDQQLDNFLSAVNWNKNEIKIVKHVNAIELENLQYKHPFINRISPIILADYVSDVDGTGLVHNAPGFGLDDYLACKKHNINIYAPIDDFGKYDASINDKELEGMFYLDANNIIIERLKASGHLLHSYQYNHRVACDWRTKKPVIYRATEQWFINLQKVSEKIIHTLKNDVKSPFQKNTDRMIEMIKNRAEWCISRQRIWGVPIPIIFDANKQPILDIDLIQNIINVLDKNGTDVWFEWPVEKFLTSKYLSTGENFYKEIDIMDVWFDSGSTHQMFKVWGLNYPADIYLEGSDQYRGWFNSSLITGTIQNDHAPYKAILQHGFTLDENGIKMSKSIGNVIDPLKMFEIYGADVFRLWVASCEYIDDQRFGENIIKQVAEIYRKIRNTLLKYSLGILNNFKPEDIQTDFSLEDKYILDSLNNVLNIIDDSYKNYKFSEIVKALNNFTIELSSWYFDLIKDEIYCGRTSSLRTKQIQTTIYKIVSSLLIALAPIIPHTADEAYQYLPFKKYSSVHLEYWFNIETNKYLNDDQLNSFNLFFKLKNDVYTALENARKTGLIKKSNAAVVTLKQNNTSFELKTLKTYLNVAEVAINESQIDDVIVTSTNYKRCERCWNHYNDSEMCNDELCNRCNDVINN